VTEIGVQEFFARHLPADETDASFAVLQRLARLLDVPIIIIKDSDFCLRCLHGRIVTCRIHHRMPVGAE
jgi:hypothetical protein